MSSNKNTSQDQTDKIKVGKIKDAHGLKGDLYYLSFSRETSWLDDLPEVYFEKNENGNSTFEKYQLTDFKDFKDGAIIKLKGVTDRTMAEKLKGLSLYIPSEELVSEPGETIYLSEIKNFKVVNPENVDLGTIAEFSSNGAQDILVIKNDQFSYEVPFVDDFVVEIKHEEKTIVMDFPESLMEVNREP